MPVMVTYWFGVQSPFSYLGHARVREACLRNAARLAIKPVDAPHLFASTGGLPVAQRHPFRQAYRLTELRRWSTYLHLPLNLEPKFFPVDPQLASCTILAAEQLHGVEAALDVTGAFMRGVWVDDRDIADASALAELLSAQDIAPLPVLELARSKEIVAKFESNTRDAVESQVFGLPTYALEGELFWGQDRIDFLDRALYTRAL